MIMIITLILGTLVALNFLLLIFSCNKTSKRITNESPVMYKTTKTAEKVPATTQHIARTQPQTQLAPTGS
ncbi:hypothetical protein [Psychroserpens sp.]|uniref:hypothetical protein n=1 Tax=Psychroserpens sp. TaxID=2020870 RepID=UPI002B268083|nr:hypothetical protein [Psychroserpens sp.]